MQLRWRTLNVTQLLCDTDQVKQRIQQLLTSLLHLTQDRLRQVHQAVLTVLQKTISFPELKKSRKLQLTIQGLTLGLILDN